MKNLHEFIAVAVANNVDFEIWHGQTTNKTASVRTHMLIKLAGCPETVATFGDEQHGKRLSEITLSVNPNIRVTAEDLFSAIEKNTHVSTWARHQNEMDAPDVPDYSSLSVMYNPDNNLSLTGRANKDGEFIVQNKYFAMSGEEINGTPIVYRLKEGVHTIPAGEEVLVLGTYQFPNYLTVTDVIPQ